jgi:hypothetical protein
MSGLMSIRPATQSLLAGLTRASPQSPRHLAGGNGKKTGSVKLGASCFGLRPFIGPRHHAVKTPYELGEAGSVMRPRRTLCKRIHTLVADSTANMVKPAVVPFIAVLLAQEPVSFRIRRLQSCTPPFGQLHRGGYLTESPVLF